MILGDQFRDGNVPAGMDLLPVLKKAILVLPPTVRRVRVRSDSTVYRKEFLTAAGARNKITVRFSPGGDLLSPKQGSPVELHGQASGPPKPCVGG